MKRFRNYTFLAVLLLFLFTLSASPSNADGLYVSGSGGAVFEENYTQTPGTKFDDLGYVASGAIGYKASFFKIEAQYLKVEQDSKASKDKGSPYIARSICRSEECEGPKPGGKGVGSSGSAGQDTVMVNAYLVAPWDFMVRPYVGAGIGLTDRYQYKGGLEFVFTPNISGFTEYTYFDQHGRTGDQFEAVTAGVTYYFN